MPISTGELTLPPALEASQLLRGERPLTRYSALWVGPALAVAVSSLIYLLERAGFDIRNPGSLLVLCVVYASISSGLFSGLLTSGVGMGASILFYDAGHQLAHDSAAQTRLLSVMVLLPTIALMVGLLRRREQRFQDISLHEAVLRQSREWLVTTLQSIGDAVIAVDTHRRITFMNVIAEGLTGWTESEAVGRDLHEVFRLLDESTEIPVYSLTDAVLRQGQLTGLTNHAVLVARNGTRIPIDDSASPIRNSRGDLWGVVMVFHDVSQRNAAEAAMRKSERLFRTTIEQSPLAIMICDPNGDAMRINRAWEQLYGVSRDGLAGYNLLRDPQFSSVGVMSLLQRVFEGEDVALPLIEYDPQKSGKSGSSRWIQPFAYAVKDDKDVITEVVVKIEDTTDRQQALQALRRSEERYHSLISATAQIIWTALPDGVIDDMPMWRAFTGQSRAAVQGWGWLGAVHPEDRDRTAKSWGNAVAARSTFQTSYRVRRHDGTYRAFAVRGVPILKHDGSIREWVGACTDVTEQKDAEALVAGQTRILELVATGRPPSETLVAITQLPEEQAQVKCALLTCDPDSETFKLCVAPSLPEAVGAALESSARSGTLATAIRQKNLAVNDNIAAEPGFCDLDEFTAADGLKICWAMPVIAAGGDILGVFAMFGAARRAPREEIRILETSVDLAGIALERSRVEGNLFDALAHQARTAANLSSMIDHIADAVVAVDAGGRFLFVNDVAQTIFGVSHTGRSLEEYVLLCRLIEPDGEPVPYAQHPLVRAQGGATVQGEWQIVRPGGSRIWVQGNSTSVSDAGGNKIGALLTLHDVTAEREAVRELTRANRMKDEFLAIVSHELRTPLTPILGWTALLRQSIGENGMADGSFIEQAADSIQRNAELQKRLVNDLLDSSRIMSGKLRIDPQPADFNNAVEIACTSATRIASDRSIKLEWEVDRRIPMLVFDIERVQQVLMNLLTNAIKFSREGDAVRVVSELDERTGCARCRVSDLGEGIDAELLPHIFDSFRQGDSSYTRRHGGIGLGLAISKSLIDMHGGSLEARSDGRGLGAVFTVSLPLQGERVKLWADYSEKRVPKHYGYGVCST